MFRLCQAERRDVEKGTELYDMAGFSHDKTGEWASDYNGRLGTVLYWIYRQQGVSVRWVSVCYTTRNPLGSPFPFCTHPPSYGLLNHSTTLIFWFTPSLRV